MKELEYIQASLTPVILMSGYSLILMTMTPRYSQLTSRFRRLEDYESMERVYARIQRIKFAIILASFAISIIMVMIMIIFAMYTLHIQNNSCILYLFSTSLLLMLSSMAVFSYDMSLSSASLLVILKKERTKRTNQQIGDEMVGRQQRLEIADEAHNQERVGVEMNRLNNNVSSTAPSLVQSSSS